MCPLGGRAAQIYRDSSVQHLPASFKVTLLPLCCNILKVICAFRSPAPNTAAEKEENCNPECPE